MIQHFSVETLNLASDIKASIVFKRVQNFILLYVCTTNRI